MDKTRSIEGFVKRPHVILRLYNFVSENWSSTFYRRKLVEAVPV